MSVANGQAKAWSRRAQSGFTLIEILIAFLILSIGLLGIASLLTVSKTSQYEAVQRIRAINLANDMIERIRINPSGIATYISGTQPLGADTITTEPSPDCSTASCTPAELAAHDLWRWEQILEGQAVLLSNAGVNSPAGGLTAPNGCINFAADPGKVSTGRVTVLVQWQGLHKSTDAVPSGGIICGGSAANTDSYRRQASALSYVIDEDEL